MDQQPAIAPTQDPDCGCPEPGNGAHVLRRQLLISNSRGLHARGLPAGVRHHLACALCTHVLRDGQVVPACSIMGLMMLGAGQGSSIEITAEGWDAKEALEAVAGLVEAGFNED